jgi:hypothetical protein
VENKLHLAPVDPSSSSRFPLRSRSPSAPTALNPQVQRRPGASVISAPSSFAPRFPRSLPAARLALAPGLVMSDRWRRPPSPNLRAPSPLGGKSLLFHEDGVSWLVTLQAPGGRAEPPFAQRIIGLPPARPESAPPLQPLAPFRPPPPVSMQCFKMLFLVDSLTLLRTGYCFRALATSGQGPSGLASFSDLARLTNVEFDSKHDGTREESFRRSTVTSCKCCSAM